MPLDPLARYEKKMVHQFRLRPIPKHSLLPTDKSTKIKPKTFIISFTSLSHFLHSPGNVRRSSRTGKPRAEIKFSHLWIQTHSSSAVFSAFGGDRDMNLEGNKRPQGHSWLYRQVVYRFLYHPHHELLQRKRKISDASIQS